MEEALRSFVKTCVYQNQLDYLNEKTKCLTRFVKNCNEEINDLDLSIEQKKVFEAEKIYTIHIIEIINQELIKTLSN